MKTKGKILIIDDDRPFLEMVRALLSYEEYDVVVCSNARQGMESLAQFDPDVLLLDWQMPDTNGIEVIDMIQKTRKHKDLYIIMLSGKIMTDNIVTAINAGADDYVIKPFSPDELMARIFNGVRNRKRRSVADHDRERIIKGLQKIEILSQQLTQTVSKDKRAASVITTIKESATELKDLLKPDLS